MLIGEKPIANDILGRIGSLIAKKQQLRQPIKNKAKPNFLPDVPSLVPVYEKVAQIAL